MSAKAGGARRSEATKANSETTAIETDAAAARTGLPRRLVSCALMPVWTGRSPPASTAITSHNMNTVCHNVGLTKSCLLCHVSRKNLFYEVANVSETLSVDRSRGCLRCALPDWQPARRGRGTQHHRTGFAEPVVSPGTAARRRALSQESRPPPNEPID